MKDKDIIIQNTKNLTVKKTNKKELIEKKQDVALIKKEKKTTALTKTKKNTLAKTKPSTQKKEKKSKNKTNKKELISYANEYFDLPYRYNETTVKLLAQTPKRLFVYWDISDEDRNDFIKNFGNDFFYKTTPYLHIINETLNYSFNIEINDFANSWYININDDNCKYSIILFRKFKDNITSLHNSPNTQINFINKNINIKNNNLIIASSNKIDAPNGKVNKTTYPITLEYKNIKNNTISYKQINKPQNTEFYNIFFKEAFNCKNDTIKDNPTSRI